MTVSDPVEYNLHILNVEVHNAVRVIGAAVLLHEILVWLDQSNTESLKVPSSWRRCSQKSASRRPIAFAI